MKSKTKPIKQLIHQSTKNLLRAVAARPTGKRYKTVAGMVRHTLPKRLAKKIAAINRAEKVLIAKYAKDPNHVHVREEVGSVRQVTSGTKILKRPRLIKKFYWCKICHVDME